MKKILATMLAILMIATSVLTFASCFGAKPEMDFAKIEEKFKDDDKVMVNYKKDADKLDANVEEEITLYKAAESEDDDAEYLYIIRYKDTKSAKIAYEGLKMQVDNSKKNIELEIKEYENLLKQYEDKLSSDEIADLNDDIKDLKEELEELKDDLSFGRSGKVVWYGNTSLVEATK
jgi:hypothetical protein